MLKFIIVLLALALTCGARQGWWMTEPIRWVQTNLRQTDAGLDPGGSCSKWRT